MREAKSTPSGSKLSSFFCSLFGHHYVVSKRVTSHIKEYECLHCKKQVTTDANGHLSTLTPEMKEINMTLENIYKRRHQATKQVA